VCSVGDGSATSVVVLAIEEDSGGCSGCQALATTAEARGGLTGQGKAAGRWRVGEGDPDSARHQRQRGVGTHAGVQHSVGNYDRRAVAAARRAVRTHHADLGERVATRVGSASRPGRISETKVGGCPRGAATSRQSSWPTQVPPGCAPWRLQSRRHRPNRADRVVGRVLTYSRESCNLQLVI
jgi:hypothetical protein